MSSLFSIIGIPLGYILYFCYQIVSNYGLALILFTLITRLILLPLSVKQQKSMVKMAIFRPKMEEIQKKYGKNQQKLTEEMQDRKSTRLNSSHLKLSRMPSSA